MSSIPPIDADAPNVVWAIDFQFDSTVDGKAIKIASMIDEHTRVSLLHVVERSITAERLVAELERVFVVAGGPPKVLRMDNARSWFLKRCNGSATGRSDCLIFRPDHRGQRLHRIVQQPTQEGMSQPQPLEQSVRSPSGHWRFQTRAQPPAPTFGAGLPHAGRVRCGMQAHPHPGGLPHQPNPEQTNPTLNLQETRDGSLTGTFPPSGTESRLGAPNLTLAVSTERRATLNRLQFPGPSKEFLTHRQT